MKSITGYRLKHKNSNKHYVGITSQSCGKRLMQQYVILNMVKTNYIKILWENINE
jgi:hypothetical protein